MRGGGIQVEACWTTGGGTATGLWIASAKKVRLAAVVRQAGFGSRVKPPCSIFTRALSEMTLSPISKLISKIVSGSDS